MSKCPDCKEDLIKEKFDPSYTGIEAKCLRCIKCGVWIPESGSVKQKEKSE